MTTTRRLTYSYLSLAGFLLYFQLNWAKEAGKFHDIFFRAVLSLLLCVPLTYLAVQLAHMIRTKLSGNNDIARSVRYIYPFSLFHLYWFQYVSDTLWRPAHAVIVTLFALTMGALIVRSLFAPRNSTSASYRTAELFKTTNRFFLLGLRGWRTALRSALTTEVRCRGLIFYPTTWLLLSMTGILVIKYAAFSFRHTLLFPLSMAVTVLLPVLLLQMLNALTAGIPVVKTAVLSVIVLLYSLLSFYYITEDVPFDYSVFRLNADLLTHGQSYRLLLERFRVQSVLFIVFCVSAVLLIIFLHVRKKTAPDFPRVSKKSLIITILGYAVLFALPLPTLDPVRALVSSITSYRQQQATLAAAAGTLSEEYPYFRPADPAYASPAADTLPDVILICLESANGLFIEKNTENGQPITPFFNSLIPQGIYIEHFYGNSVQTVRGFFSILTGTPPSYRGKIATSNLDLAYIGLPSILADIGYTTCFFKAYHDLSYDNTGAFMKRLGYKHIYSMTGEMLTEKEKAMCWGWGLQDDYFYRKCFDIIDTLPANRNKTGPPLFITTFNVSNHMMFQDIPNDQKYLYPDAGKQDYKKNIRNSMFLADSCLRELFIQIEQRDYLKNAIILIVGDHGFPCGMHSTKNEKGSWEENFRTPFLLLWKDHLQPRRFSGRAYSQIDLLPTILDLLDIRPAHHATGTSIFSEEPRPPVVCAQPYDGIFLTGIDYPYKYIRKFSGNSEALFDLSSDPLERDNQINNPSLKPVISTLRQSAMSLIVNQVLIDRNRLCPVER